jgi:hypothetical protein
MSGPVDRVLSRDGGRARSGATATAQRMCVGYGGVRKAVAIRVRFIPPDRQKDLEPTRAENCIPSGTVAVTGVPRGTSGVEFHPHG